MTDRGWDIVQQAASDAGGVLIAAPYIKADALRQLLASLPDRAPVTCVTRWTLPDLQAGASDLVCASVVTAVGGEFRLHPRLHAKYYRLGKTTLIGSANLTAAGMGIANESNVEILCEAPESFDAAAFEERILRESLVLDADDISAWESVVSLPDSETPDTSPLPTLWDPQTRDPEDVWVAYQGQSDAIASLEQRDFALGDLRQLAVPPGLPRTQFDAVMRVRLFSCAHAYDVLRVEAMSDAEASALLEQQWSVARSVAHRHRETVRNWIAAFLRP